MPICNGLLGPLALATEHVEQKIGPTLDRDTAFVNKPTVFFITGDVAEKFG